MKRAAPWTVFENTRPETEMATDLNSDLNSERRAKAKLIRLLQDACSGELAAFHAYDGHWRSLRDPDEQAEIKQIQKEEWEHRECLLAFLSQLGSSVRPGRERLMSLIGRSISAFCHFGGWLLPMFGAGRLERGNIVEYEIAARLAAEAGESEMVEPLLRMAEVEWDHEAYFRKKVLAHPIGRRLPLWSLPPPRESIRLNGPLVSQTSSF